MVFTKRQRVNSVRSFLHLSTQNHFNVLLILVKDGLKNVSPCGQLLERWAR